MKTDEVIGQDTGFLANTGAEFIQLNMREGQIAKQMRMHSFTVHARSSEPGRDRSFGMAKHSHGSANGQPFGDCREDDTHASRRGFEAIECCMPPPAELVVARFAIEILNRVVDAMMPITDQGMDGRIGNLPIGTGWIVAGIAIRVNGFGTTASTFHFPPWTDGNRRACARDGGTGVCATRGAIVRRARTQRAWRSCWVCRSFLRSALSELTKEPSDEEPEQSQQGK